jgi:DNA replication protein DnaC
MGTTRKGIYLHGAVGTGKTHAAWAIKKKYDKPDEGRIAKFWNVTEFLREVRADFDRTPEDKTRPERALMAHRGLVILDDIGAEKPTDFVAETLYVVINRRYEDMLPTIFTSNLDIRELALRIGDRSASRIVEMCEVVKLIGKDRRLPQ